MSTDNVNKEVEHKETDQNSLQKCYEKGELCNGVDSADCSDSQTADAFPEYPCHPAPPLEVKLFVGRIPRTYTEEDVKALIKEYGKIVSVSIIVDKATNEPKGSAFVRMACLAQADAAIRALNDQRTLDDQSGSLQVKYATGESDRLNISDEDAGMDQAKLFIGALPKNMTEEEIRIFFSTYGQIDEIYIMKDAGCILGKGCAFVKFAYKEQALFAISCLDRKHTFEGQTRALEVRFAENRTQRNTTPASSNSSAAVTTTTVAAAASTYTTNPLVQLGTTSPATPLPRQAGVWREYYNHDGRPYYFNESTNVTQWDKPAEFDQLHSALPVQTPAVPAALPFALQAAGAQFYAAVNQSAKPGSSNGGLVSQEIGIGPKGANIFIFHVPPEWTQADLVAAFSPFGNVISARIATDRAAENKAKGYAFVSYDTIEAAASAVNHMNGFAWKGKKLKVSIKKHEESVVQHLLIPGVTPSALAQSPGVMAAAAGLYGGALAGLGALGLAAATPQAGVGLTTTTGGVIGLPAVGSSLIDQSAITTIPVATLGNISTSAPVFSLCNAGGILPQTSTTQPTGQFNIPAHALPVGQFGALGGGRYAPY